MADFPQGVVLPPVISTFTEYGPAHEMRSLAVVGQPASSTVTANQATYVPMAFPFPYPVRRVFWANGSTISTNADFGIYTAGGARIYSTGSTAQTPASRPQYVSVATPFILSPGAYYFAIVSSGTTNALQQNVTVTAVPGRFMGMLQQATALPLPATMTGAAWASTGYPLIGITL